MKIRQFFKLNAPTWTVCLLAIALLLLTATCGWYFIKVNNKANLILQLYANLYQNAPSQMTILNRQNGNYFFEFYLQGIVLSHYKLDEGGGIVVDE